MYSGEHHWASGSILEELVGWNGCYSLALWVEETDVTAETECE